MDADRLRLLSDVFWWLVIGVQIYQISLSLPGKGSRPRFSYYVLTPILVVCEVLFAATAMARDRYLSGVGYAALAVWQFWHWWNDDDIKRRRRKWKAALKRRVAVVAGRTKVVEA